MALMEGSLSTSLLVVEPRELALKSTWWRPVLTFLIYANDPPTHANLSISIGKILKHCPARPVAQFCCRAHCHTSPSASPHPWASCSGSMHSSSYLDFPRFCLPLLLDFSQFLLTNRIWTLPSSTTNNPVLGRCILPNFSQFSQLLFRSEHKSPRPVKLIDADVSAIVAMQSLEIVWSILFHKICFFKASSTEWWQ